MKKMLPLALSLSLMLICALTSLGTEGEELTLLLHNKGGEAVNVTKSLTDDNIFTSVKIKAGEFLTIEGEDCGKSAYMKWNTYPAQGWELLEGIDGENGEGRKITENNSGFLHEYWVLPKNPPKTMKMVFKSDAVLCDFSLFCGELPLSVQRWNPPLEKADILVMSTHADDEHLYLGAPLALYGGNPDFAVQVAYMVNHNGEPYRNHEL
ncbi:MAG: hypothetical protein RR315_03300, partial [Oscillospiraceae bacterium]